MKRQKIVSPRKKIALAAILIGVILCLLTLFFARDVRQQLWLQSVNTIRESTQQGRNTLQVQLQEEFATMDSLARHLQRYTPAQPERLTEILDNYGKVEAGVSLYLESNTYPAAAADEPVREQLERVDAESGIIDPHISSFTGVNVFDLFVRVDFADGSTGYLVKEYEVDAIVDSFSLSFYDDAGFSYVVNADGDVLIRPPHPNSNKTVQNLFDMLPEGPNDAASLTEFADALHLLRSGWAVFTYQGEDTVFCYTPLKLNSNWYVISIIPQDVVNAQTTEIVRRSLALIFTILLGIALLALFYLRHARRANRRLRSQAAYASHLYNAVPEGIALLTIEAPYRFLQLNAEGLRLLDYPKDAANDAPRGRLLQEVIDPQDYEKISALLQQAAAGSEKKTFENRICQADGDLLWVSGVVEKTRDENGAPILIASFHDITAQKLAEQEAEREKMQERLLLVGAVASVYPLIISINLDTDRLKFIYARSGLLVHVGEQQTYSRLYEEFIPSVHPDSREDFVRRFAPENLKRALVSEKKEVFLEARQKLTDGQYHWTSTQIIGVENPYSHDQLAILISRRIDEQRYEEEQQRQALRSALDNARAASLAKSQFLSNMSHDIRTPMNAIVGMTAIASAHLDDRERVLACLHKIDLSSKHLLSLINDVLDMSKIESGKLTLREEPFNFTELVADSVELIRAQADAKQLELVEQPAVLDNEQVVGDPLRIRQVYLNILSNAIKYTPAGGRVRIAIKQEESTRPGYQRYTFCCEDSGVGMDEAFLARLYLPFERSQDAFSSQIAGTGLGMAITKNLIDLLSGEIQVQSTPGEGSIFTVTLPLRLQETPAEQAPLCWRGAHALVVDDDRESCENAVALLAALDIRAEFATRGEEALCLAAAAKQKGDPFKLMIADWKMPGMDGIRLTRRFRAQIGADVPVIILTANDWDDIEQEARQAGVSAFLSKPFYRAKICYLLYELSGRPAASDPASALEDDDFNGKKVLLVEDNLMNREIARTLIEEMGIEVDEAGDGAQAVERIAHSQEGEYDLILMDIRMPKMDGYEATRAIRALPRADAKRLPIIAMTANAFEEDIHAALHAGMNAHFAKPIDVEAFKQMLRTYLAAPPAAGDDRS